MTQAARRRLDEEPPDIEPTPTKRELDALEQDRQRQLTPQSSGWSVWISTGGANAFHNYQPGHVNHELWVRHLPRSSLVLGSTQSAKILSPDVRNVDIEICRRRSGGGLVHLDATRDVWIDVLVPNSSPLWNADLAKSFHWLGVSWADIVRRLLPGALVSAHEGPSRGSGRTLCFAGLGHGEITVDGRKVVGLSQRRTKNWARFQCAVIQRWPAAELSRILRQQPGSPDPHHVAAGLASGKNLVAPSDVVEQVLASVAARTPEQLANNLP